MSSAMDSPTYVSARSADVILGEVRPIRLKADALRAINVLLDELLWTLIADARSLVSDRLNSALRRVLPTSLGKEALLEAEVELRAYLEKSTPLPSPLGEEEEFSVQCAFELMRLKCEAYATLNDQDEDLEAEKRLHERMGGLPPPTSLVAPAALYLTAVLECICEHILSTVGRVVARDSSRTMATIQDLFVALCEDDAIYGLFKTMKVYSQIEQMTQETPHQRKKSHSTSGDGPSRTGSSVDAEPKSTSPHRSSASRSRRSSESARTSGKSGSRSGSPSGFRRTSLEKARALKELMSNGSGNSARSSNDQSGREDVPPLSRKTDSGLSEDTKQTWKAFSASVRSATPSTTETDPDDISQEFDDLMRSGSTVKMSLTPDRLKTMEVHNREKVRGRGTSKPASKLAEHSVSYDDIAADPDPPSSQPPPAATAQSRSSAPAHPTRRPSAPQVESIPEDEAESPVISAAPPPRRRNSVAAAQANESASQSSMRIRAISLTAGPAKPPAMPPVPPPRLPPSIVTSARPPVIPDLRVPTAPKRRTPSPGAMSADGRPERTRRMGKNRESLDLDDVMNGSDEDEPASASVSDFAASKPGSASLRTNSRATTPTTATSGVYLRGPKTPVSRSTRDLMDFLDAGPPEEPSSPLSRTTSGSGSQGTSKSGGGKNRLQRMVSRLTRGASQEHLRARAEADARAAPLPPLPVARPPPPPSAFLNGQMRTINGQTFIAPKPPRPPPVIPVSALPPSPPASPPHRSLEEERPAAAPHAQVPSPPATVGAASGAPQRRISIQRKAVPVWDTAENGTPPEGGAGALSRQSSVKGASPAESAAALQPPAGAREGEHAPSPATSPRRGPASLPPSAPSGAAARAASLERTRSSGSSRSGKIERHLRAAPLPPIHGAVPAPLAPAPAPARVSTGVHAVPAPDAAPADLQRLRELMARATSADECRLLVDMLLIQARGAAPAAAAASATSDAVTEGDVPYPSPVRSDAPHIPPPVPPPSSDATAIEQSLVELLLGGGESLPAAHEPPSVPAVQISA